MFVEPLEIEQLNMTLLKRKYAREDATARPWVLGRLKKPGVRTETVICLIMLSTSAAALANGTEAALSTSLPPHTSSVNPLEKELAAKVSASSSGPSEVTQDTGASKIIPGTGWRVVYFWSATCPCVRACESFTFAPLARRYHGRVAFYAVASNSYDLKLPYDQFAHQVREHTLPFPVLRDDNHLIAKALGARVTPQAFLLDPAGKVVFSGMPDDSRRYQNRTGKWGVSETYLDRAITQSLTGQPVTVPRVKDEGCIIAW